MNNLFEGVKELWISIRYFIYQKFVFRDMVKVRSIDETIDALVGTENSIIRFGDGEISLIAGRAGAVQRVERVLGERLKEVLASNEDNLLIAINDIFTGMKDAHKKNQIFMKKHAIEFGSICCQVYQSNRVYYNAQVTRCYYHLADRSLSGQYFEKIKSIWKGKKVVVVEGESTHNGVGNDLLSGAISVKRVLCPSTDAFRVYDEILETCVEFDADNLFLLSLGPTANLLAYDLFKRGYRVIDIGNVDLEYEWYLRKASGKIPLEKHQIIGIEANKKAGYDEYISQIVSCVL